MSEAKPLVEIGDVGVIDINAGHIQSAVNAVSDTVRVHERERTEADSVDFVRQLAALVVRQSRHCQDVVISLPGPVQLSDEGAIDRVGPFVGEAVYNNEPLSLGKALHDVSEDLRDAVAAGLRITAAHRGVLAAFAAARFHGQGQNVISGLDIGRFLHGGTVERWPSASFGRTGSTSPPRSIYLPRSDRLWGRMQMPGVFVPTSYDEYCRQPASDRALLGRGIGSLLTNIALTDRPEFVGLCGSAGSEYPQFRHTMARYLADQCGDPQVSQALKDMKIEPLPFDASKRAPAHGAPGLLAAHRVIYGSPAA